jgi:hypothetical protein
MMSFVYFPLAFRSEGTFQMQKCILGLFRQIVIQKIIVTHIPPPVTGPATYLVVA